MFNKKIHKRIKIALLVIIFCFILIIGKVFYIQVIDYNKLNNLANNLWSRNLVIGANRGKILTSDNTIVADNLTTVSLVVITNQIKNTGRRSPRAIPLRPCASSYDLHDYAGGSLLRTLAAPNIHLSSKRRREVCNPARKSCVPNI